MEGEDDKLVHCGGCCGGGGKRMAPSGQRVGREEDVDLGGTEA
jgi:hypothetical protein